MPLPLSCQPSTVCTAYSILWEGRGRFSCFGSSRTVPSLLRYTIDAAVNEVRGNWWDMIFQVLQHGKDVGEVGKEWFTWGDSYRVRVIDEEMETIMIALVVAIDCVKADESAASSGASLN
jgi:uncharacterized protein YxjI